MWSEALCLAYAALAQLVEHRIRIDWLSVYASLWGNLEVKRSLKRGNLNSPAVGNPVLVPVGMSVETLYDPPTAIGAMVKRKSRPQTSRE